MPLPRPSELKIGQIWREKHQDGRIFWFEVVELNPDDRPTIKLIEIESGSTSLWVGSTVDHVQILRFPEGWTYFGGGNGKT
jgi:hypothetical protein